MSADNDSRKGFFRGGLDIPDDMAKEIYGQAQPAAVAESHELALIMRIAQENARYLATGRENPKREDDVEALLRIYDHKPEFREHVLWALGEIRCSEAAVMIIGIARNWEKHMENGRGLVETAVGALGKIDSSRQSICILMCIAETKSAPDGLREKAAISAESMAARMGSAELSRVRIKLEECGARQLPGVQRWIDRNKPQKQPSMRVIHQKGGTC